MLVFFGAVSSWLRERQRPDWLRLAGLFAGLAFWVKQDALIFVARRKQLALRPVAVTGVVETVAQRLRMAERRSDIKSRSDRPRAF